MKRQFDVEALLDPENKKEVKRFFTAIEKAHYDYEAGQPGMVLAQIYLSTDKKIIRVIGTYVEPEITGKIKRLLHGRVKKC